LLGRSPKILNVYKAIGRVANQDVAVLLVGESGTGKEQVARAICRHSDRATRPFLAVQCSGIHESLLESELFGHERGLMAGSGQPRPGKFERCANGTVFLDEIGATSLSVQFKVLRLLQQQQLERSGGTSAITVQTRIIAATNRDLESLVMIRRFREDLLYRLQSVTIRIPALRDRAEDIPMLVEDLIDRYSATLCKVPISVSSSAMDVLQNYPWPGNCRELLSVVRRAVSRAEGSVLLPEHIPLSVIENVDRPLVPRHLTAGRGPSVDFLAAFIRERLAAGSNDLYSETIRCMDRILLPAVLGHTNGNQSQAAKILGITRGSLRTKLRELGIRVSQIVTSAATQQTSEMPHAG
jgi:two-component system nitrogen regulation response regulator GlnG